MNNEEFWAYLDGLADTSTLDKLMADIDAEFVAKTVAHIVALAEEPEKLVEFFIWIADTANTKERKTRLMALNQRWANNEMYMAAMTKLHAWRAEHPKTGKP